MMAGKKLRPASRARLVHHFADGSSHSRSLVDTALSMIRQWVAIESLAVSSPDEWMAREAVRAKLRRVAEFAINAEFDLFASEQGGAKGGRQPKQKDAQQQQSTKRAAIIAEAAAYAGTESARVATIARRSKSTPQYVRRVLNETGN